jgi:DNA-binding LacI/PurR family transcriptional regulator
MSSPTLRELAKGLGMGKSTVQRALTGAGGVSEETVRRVQTAAKKVGYVPDPLFSILGTQSRHRRTNLLQLAYIGRKEFSENSPQSIGINLLKGLREYGLTLGFDVKYVDPEAVGGSQRLMDILYHRGFVGVLIGQLRSPDHEAILANTHLPVVCCGRVDPLPLHTVQPDVSENLRVAWRNLVQRGYRSIGAAICTHLPICRDDADRLATLLACQHEMPDKSFPPFLSPLKEMEAFVAWFKKFKPDALLGFSPAHYFALQSAGVDMARIGFASLQAAHDTGSPLIAGIDERIELIPVEALNLLDRLIRHRTVGIPDPPLRILIPGRWYEGQSLQQKAANSQGRNARKSAA